MFPCIQIPKGKQDCDSLHIKDKGHNKQHRNNKTSSEQNVFKTKKLTYACGLSAKTVAIQNRLPTMLLVSFHCISIVTCLRPALFPTHL